MRNQIINVKFTYRIYSSIRSLNNKVRKDNVGRFTNLKYTSILRHCDVPVRKKPLTLQSRIS